jgi:hypothetical protein
MKRIEDNDPSERACKSSLQLQNRGGYTHLVRRSIRIGSKEVRLSAEIEAAEPSPDNKKYLGCASMSLWTNASAAYLWLGG